jgi:hypothetical protein
MLGVFLYSEVTVVNCQDGLSLTGLVVNFLNYLHSDDVHIETMWHQVTSRFFLSVIGIEAKVTHHAVFSSPQSIPFMQKAVCVILCF